MYMCESLVHVQECISLACRHECGPSTSLLPCGFILPGVQPCPVYAVCVCVCVSPSTGERQLLEGRTPSILFTAPLLVPKTC